MAIRSWTELVVEIFQDLWASLFSSLVLFVGALVIFLLGLLVASVIGRLVEKIVNLIKLDKVLENLGVKEYFERGGIELKTGKFFGGLTYWFLVVVALLAASDVLRFESLSIFLGQVLNFIPSIIAAVLIMLAALLIGGFLKKIVSASVKSARLHGGKFLSELTWWAVVIFGFLAALTQLGVAVSLINTIVTGLIAMIALAGGIAFGLGGKDYASHLIEKIRKGVE